MVSALPLLMVGFLFSCYLTGRGKVDFGDKLITLVADILGFNFFNKTQRKTILLNFFSTLLVSKKFR